MRTRHSKLRLTLWDDPSDDPGASEPDERHPEINFLFNNLESNVLTWRAGRETERQTTSRRLDDVSFKSYSVSLILNVEERRRRKMKTDDD